MSTEVRQSIADSRAQYFSDFNGDPGGSGSDDLNYSGDTSEDDTGQRKPSYVGLSHAINGYTQYSQYNGRVKKISPPLQIPVSPPRTLDSVGLVLSQDSYHRSVTEFEQVMRDLSNGSLDMARPQRNADVIDAARVASKRHVISNGDSFYPKTQNRQIIGDGDKQSVEIVTKFHCDEDHSPTYRPSPNGSRQNLVQKQIERLYGDTGPYQVRMTSPEPVDGENGEPVNGHSPQNGDSEKAERKSSGGFFAKRFGLVKMKDHSSRKVIESRNSENSDNNQMDFKPLKVPAVFRLLRPEFREQLKQSSCKIDANVVTPTSEKGKEWSKERIIPIRREGGGDSNHKTNGKTPTPERVVPINVSQNTNNDANGVLNNNNNNMKTPSSAERVIPIRRESGEINSTPKRPVGFAPKVNGFNTSNNMLSLRNGSISSKPTASEDKPSDNKVETNGTNVKQGIVRKLSPLSPKHIVVPNSAEKPAPMPKPDHLKSPPMTPEPVNGTGSSPSPPLPRGDRSPSSPTPPSPSSPSASVPDQQEPKVGKPVEPAVAIVPVVPAPPTPVVAESGRINGDNDNGISNRPLLTPDTQIVSPEVINNNINNKPELGLDSESFEDFDRNNGGDYDNPEEYPEEYYYDNPPPCGLRERELLCPIMEEDNESTASGSIMNLAERSNGAVIGKKRMILEKYFIFTENVFQIGTDRREFPV